MATGAVRAVDDLQVTRDDLALAGIDVRHEVVDVAPPDVLGLFAQHDLRIVSMGRPAADDPVMFQAAAAAGRVAAARIPPPRGHTVRPG